MALGRRSSTCQVKSPIVHGTLMINNEMSEPPCRAVRPLFKRQVLLFIMDNLRNAVCRARQWTNSSIGSCAAQMDGV